MMMRVLFLPVLSGILYWLSSQAFSFPLAVWVCLVPLGLSFYKTSPGKGFAGGLVYGFCLWFAAVWWIKIPLINMVHIPPWQAWGWTVVFCALHALPYGVFGYLAGKFCLMESWLGAAFASVSLVVIRTWCPLVFPGSEAHNLYAWPIFIQVLDLGGAPLLLFFIYFVNFQIVRALTARRSHGSPAPAVVSIAIAFILLAGYGGYRLQSLHQQMNAAGSGQQITVLSIQPNVPISQDNRDVPPHDRGNDIKTALSLSHKAAVRYPGADLVVWPEIPLAYHCRAEAGRDVPPLAKETGKAFMLPCTSMIGDRGEAYYNSVIFFDKNGVAGEEYRKLILIPFGEYIPMERQFPFLRRMFPGVMPFVAGNRGEVSYDFGRGIRLMPSLCYEAIFTEHCRRFVGRGGNVLINMVDDAWFGKSPASVIHMSLAMFRSVEYRIPMVRVTNTGVGIFVQPTGEIVPGSQTPLFQKAATAHTLYIPPARSPYERWGDAFLYGLTGLFIMGLIWFYLTFYGFTPRGIIRTKPK
ncbi:MAG: apolipoprotein N-acyltransferase [Deltaproteobacteria bacterium]|nr:apolipoprotein N-acyltransferase [Deltaproteobacteria bacterium]